jgi:hypothetical protein
LANLKLKQQQKKKAEEEKKKQGTTDSVTVRIGKQTIVVTVQQMNPPAALDKDKKIEGVKRVGIGVQLVFTITDGKGNPLVGATATEVVVALKGDPIDQNPRPVPLNDGKGADWVSNSAPVPTNSAEERAIIKRVLSPFVTEQKLTLTITTAGGSQIQVTQIRTLTNLTPGGQLQPEDRGLSPGVPGYTFTMQHMTARVLKR